MDLSSIKLVVTDMDGTLLNASHEVSPLFFELFSKLKSHIHFVAASGRQYHSIAHKLAPIFDDITIVAENGGLVKRQHEELFSTKLQPQLIQSILPKLKQMPNTGVILAGKEAAYVDRSDPEFLQMFVEFYSSYQIVNSFEEVADDIMKIAVYHPQSSEQFIYPLIKELGLPLQSKISGQHWLDIADFSINKGEAIRRLQEELKISKAETMVFGDFHNDLEMLMEADFSFAMENAHPEVKKIAQYQTAHHNEFGVERILEKLLASKK